MNKGTSMQNNYMMRLRVIAQGFTVFSLVGFAAFETWKNSNTPPEPVYHNYPPNELTSQITTWQNASTNPLFNDELRTKLEQAKAAKAQSKNSVGEGSKSKN